MHSAWHVLVGIALFLLLPYRKNRPQVESTREAPVGVGPQDEPLVALTSPHLEEGSGSASTSSTPSSSGSSGPLASSSQAGKCNYCLVDGDDALAALGETAAPGPDDPLAPTRVCVRRQSSSSLDEPERGANRTMHVSSVSLVASSAAAAHTPTFPRRALSALLGTICGSRSDQHHVVPDLDPLVLDPLGRNQSNH